MSGQNCSSLVESENFIMPFTTQFLFIKNFIELTRNFLISLFPFYFHINQANVGGVFVVLMGGMGIACVIAVCEFVWKSRKVAIEEKVITRPNGHQNYPSLLH